MIMPTTNIPQHFDPLVVKKWLGCCRERHFSICNKTRGEVLNLELIDCQNSAVVSAPSGALYVALSYVWGKRPTAPSVDRSALPSLLPAAVVDAIAVTRALGYRYLWVDKFCIDQTNASKKENQIQQMDLIYHKAELTIVSAAGIDENYGLPGVGKRSRSLQPSLRIGDIEFLSTSPHPHESIRSSVWASRGWTFQEAFLSRRVLVFLDDQVYFECKTMNCWESATSNLENLCVDNQPFDHHVSRTAFGGSTASFKLELYSPRIRSRFERYLTATEDYSSRNLTFAEDSLNAFIGVTKYFQSIEAGLPHLWGLPIRDRPVPQSTRSPILRASLIFVLTWTHKPFRPGETPPERRGAFPSWSWCGWRGAIQFAPFDPDEVLLDDKISNLRLELEPGHLVEPECILCNQTLFSKLAHHPRILHFSAQVVPAEAVSRSPVMTTWRIYDRQAHFKVSRALLTDDQVVDGWRDGRWEVLWMGRQKRTNFLLVVEWKGGLAERIGMITTDMIGYSSGVFGELEKKDIRLA